MKTILKLTLILIIVSASLQSLAQSNFKSDGYVISATECLPRSIEEDIDYLQKEPFINGAAKMSFDKKTLTFSLLNYRYSCYNVDFNPIMKEVGDTLDIFIGATEFDHDYMIDSKCTCEINFEIGYDSIEPKHYIINLRSDKDGSIYASCDTTLADGFQHLLFDNRKPLPENHFLGSDYEESGCIAKYEPFYIHNDDDMPPVEELGSVKLSYEQDTLKVELRGWLYYCWHDSSPYAIVEDDNIFIRLDMTLATSCLCYQTMSFNFVGIKPGKYRVKLLFDEHYGPRNRIYDVDLKDGFSKLFLKDTNALKNINKLDSKITFDGCLVEFNSETNAVVEIYSTEGERLLMTEGNGRVRLSVGVLMPGIYIVKVTTVGGKTFQQKIVVK